MVTRKHGVGWSKLELGAVAVYGLLAALFAFGLSPAQQAHAADMLAPSVQCSFIEAGASQRHHAPVGK